MPPKTASGKKSRASTRSARSARLKLNIFDLPLEVRDIIYIDLLTEKTAIKPKVHCSARDEFYLCHAHRHIHRAAVGLQPQILRVSRQINEETSRILYGRNTFKFDDEHYCCPHPYEDMSLDFDMDEEDFIHAQEVHDFKLFLIDIGPENRMLLRKLEFRFTAKQVLGRINHLGLRSSGVKIDRYMGKSFEDGFKILEAGHSLLSLQILLDGHGLPDEMIARDDLLQAICRIKNIPDLQIKSDCVCHPDHVQNQLARIERMLRKPGVNAKPQLASNTTTSDVWRKSPPVKSSSADLTGDQLMDRVRRLVKEQKTLRARIAEDTERDDFIANMLAKARGLLS